MLPPSLKVNIAIRRKHTKGRVVPLMTTPSANRTREGLFFNLAFLAALNRADLRVDWINRTSMKETRERENQG